MSKRFFDCSLTAADAPKISFVPQKWCRSSRACIAAPDVLTTMCRRQSSPNFEMALGIQRQNWKQLRGVCRADRQVMLWPTYKRITTTYNDVQTHHKSTTIVQTASELARGPQISRSHTGAPAFCSTHWNQGNKSEHSQRSMFLKNIVKIWPKRGRVASGLQFAGRLPVQPSSLNISLVQLNLINFSGFDNGLLLVKGNKSLAQLWGFVAAQLWGLVGFVLFQEGYATSSWQ